MIRTKLRERPRKNKGRRMLNSGLIEVAHLLMLTLRLKT